MPPIKFPLNLTYGLGGDVIAGHLGYLNGMFLTVLNLYVTVMLPNKFWLNHTYGLEPASVAQLDALSDWRPEGRWFNPRQGQQHSFVEIDREIFSTVILSLPLIQEGQMSVSGKRMCTILVDSLED